jgi:hypothetical protein
MCFEDVKIGQATRSNLYIASTSTTKIPANPNRLSIRLITDAVTATLRAVTSTGTIVLPNHIVVGTPTPQNVIIAQVRFAPGSNQVPIIPDSGWICDEIEPLRIGQYFYEELQLIENGGGIAYAIETYLPVTAGRSLDIAKLPE